MKKNLEYLVNSYLFLLENGSLPCWKSFINMKRDIKMTPHERHEFIRDIVMHWKYISTKVDALRVLNKKSYQLKAVKSTRPKFTTKQQVIDSTKNSEESPTNHQGKKTVKNEPSIPSKKPSHQGKKTMLTKTLCSVALGVSLSLLPVYGYAADVGISDQDMKELDAITTKRNEAVKKANESVGNITKDVTDFKKNIDQIASSKIDPTTGASTSLSEEEKLKIIDGIVAKGKDLINHLSENEKLTIETIGQANKDQMKLIDISVKNTKGSANPNNYENKVTTDPKDYLSPEEYKRAQELKKQYEAETDPERKREIGNNMRDMTSFAKGRIDSFNSSIAKLPKDIQQKMLSFDRLNRDDITKLYGSLGFIQGQIQATRQAVSYFQSQKVRLSSMTRNQVNREEFNTLWDSIVVFAKGEAAKDTNDESTTNNTNEDPFNGINK